jgi:ribosome-binding protein aMBF1 (putative translation factor)
MKHETATWDLLQDMIAAVPEEMKKQYDYSFAISDRLDAILKERGISQKELARMTGKRPSDVKSWLTGTHNFSLSTIAKLSTALNYDFLQIA